MKKPTLVDVTNMSVEEFETATDKVSVLSDLDKISAGELLYQLISSIADPSQGNGRPAMMKIKHNSVVISLAIAIVDCKTIGTPEGTTIN